MEDNGKIIALLIDAENISPKYIQVIFDELSLYGTPAYKRIYGDWTSTDMASWKKTLLENNLTPIQQFSYTQGKNASDSAMIIDAMDILYTKNCDGFCLVSSDSDFTRLASRLRESRMSVIGMGESKTPMAFKAACDVFRYLDVLFNAKNKASVAATQKANEPEKAARAKKAATKPAKAGKATKTTAPAVLEPTPIAEEPTEVPAAFLPLNELVAKIHDVIEHDSNEEGYMSLAQVGHILGRLYVDFDTRNYGFSKLHKLLDATGEFETRSDQIPGGGQNVMVRNK
ncbi:NYN domain-containing protein [Ruminococcaceae bacterium OttesenSCG-928-A16]|nr:NYN domain-containing protein [Ruminococcaceae bacterium OttesenSCG-928-A16]